MRTSLGPSAARASALRQRTSPCPHPGLQRTLGTDPKRLALRFACAVRRLPSPWPWTRPRRWRSLGLGRCGPCGPDATSRQFEGFNGASWRRPRHLRRPCCCAGPIQRPLFSCDTYDWSKSRERSSPVSWSCSTARPSELAALSPDLRSVVCACRCCDGGCVEPISGGPLRSVTKSRRRSRIEGLHVEHGPGKCFCGGTPQACRAGCCGS